MSVDLTPYEKEYGYKQSRQQSRPISHYSQFINNDTPNGGSNFSMLSFHITVL